MKQSRKKILIVDDEALNLEMLEEDLTDAGYEVVVAEDGLIAWEYLQEDPEIDVILLDRMMPNMDGMEVIKKLKVDKKLKNIPIIMQTAASSTKQIKEGIDAGVFYYLTKPFSEEIMLSIVASAIEDREQKTRIKEGIKKQEKTMGLMRNALFEFKTPSEVKGLSYMLANGFPTPESVALGISELMLNAIEHGNLGINYDEKKELIVNCKLPEEIERRLNQAENKKKIATVLFEKLDNKIKLTIKDEGKGFDWKSYMEISSKRVTDPNGRGIAMANMTSFDKIEYKGSGNEVICTVLLGRDN